MAQREHQEVRAPLIARSDYNFITREMGRGSPALTLTPPLPIPRVQVSTLVHSPTSPLPPPAPLSTRGSVRTLDPEGSKGLLGTQ